MVCALRALDEALRNLHRQHPAGQFLGGIAQADVRHTLRGHGWVVPRATLVRSHDVARIVTAALTLHDVHPERPPS